MNAPKHQTGGQSHASELFARAGRVLYGDAWQSPLAHALQINLRTVQRIAASAAAAEPYRINPAVMKALAELVRERESQLKDARIEIEKTISIENSLGAAMSPLKLGGGRWKWKSPPF